MNEKEHIAIFFDQNTAIIRLSAICHKTAIKIGDNLNSNCIFYNLEVEVNEHTNDATHICVTVF
ncbi:hypothetical protein PCA01_27450 [Pseudoalteromonas carrageenovora]|nr:hypothetical protein PCA01_27450 [Pseudoalteromonas carrageenovora]